MAVTESDFETIEPSELDEVSGGFAFLIPLLGAALGAVQGGISSKQQSGKIDWMQVASGALSGLGMGNLGGSAKDSGAESSSDRSAPPAPSAPSAE